MIFFGCQKSQKPETIEYPMETAKLVSHVTSGVISSNEKIRVRFVNPIIKENQVGNTLKKNVFQFDPHLDGISNWEDRRTLVFEPNNRLPLRQIFRGSLDVQSLIPEHETELEPLRFQFTVNGREISMLSTEFKLQSENDPFKLYLEGEVFLTEKTILEEIKSATQLFLKSTELTLEWQEKGDGKTFSFTSEIFTRKKDRLTLELKIEKDDLELSSDYSKQIILSPLGKMEVVDIRIQDDGKNPGLKIEFSDELNVNQDISGLVEVNPAIHLRLKKNGKFIQATGEFSYGQQYEILIHKGIRSRWGTITEDEFTESIDFEDLKPQIRFSSSGVFLPSQNQQKIRFQTLNVREVQLQIKRVFESNLGQFLQTERLQSSKQRSENFGYSYVDRVGVEVVKQSLEIGSERNTWLQHELDLSELIQPKDKGLYLISLTFKREDMLYGEESESRNDRRRYYYGTDYYTNPFSRGYLYQHGQIYKPVIRSDIGLTYFAGYTKHVVYAMRIEDAATLSGVDVKLRTYQNQIIAEQQTDFTGKAEFKKINEKVFYIEAEKNGQRSVIKLNEMAWNVSTFDTGGEISEPDGTQAFIYTERGVYRPGDVINISVIARNKDKTFPENHPITIKIYNPRNQLAYEYTERKAIDGFYNFKFTTNENDPTGNWRAEVKVGSKKFVHILKIETVAPYRLKIKFEPQKSKLDWTDKELNLNLESTYLFGNPAANLNAEVEISINSLPKAFKKYDGFTFTNESVEFKSITSNIFTGNLNNEGKAKIKWRLPSFEQVPSAIRASIKAKVLEKGGRPNYNSVVIPIEPYQYYVGIQKPQTDYGHLRTGMKIQIPVIVVNHNGDAISGRALKYKIYKGRRHWWWEYDNYNEFKLKFKSDTDTELVTDGNIISQNIPVFFDFTPDDRGQYLIEVQDGDPNGHLSSFFIGAYPWGEGPASEESGGTISLITDKKSYNPGENAIVRFPAPNIGEILYSLQRGTDILNTKWIDPPTEAGEMEISIPITKEMAPTAYASISIIQPHSQTLNDRPIRIYGVVPINVEDALTHQHLQIQMPAELESDKPFTVKIQNLKKEKTQFTIAVVDEGILDITRFKTPDPWKSFFRKLKMGVNIYDLYSFIIGANKGDIFKTFSIGGALDEFMASADLQEKAEQRKRFKPVSMFKGPIMTNQNGFAEVTFDMPNYIGSVRVMVVSAKENSYGSAEKTVSVTKDLMVMPTLPRVLGPEDKITVPVTVFTMKDGLGKVDVSISVDGPLDIVGLDKRSVEFKEKGEKDIQFEIEAKAAVGFSKIIITAKSEKMSTSVTTDLEIRASSPRLSESIDQQLIPGESVVLKIPDKGLPGSNNASISIQRRPNMDFSKRLTWLIRYPYGCIEQTISAVFPQLYLKEFLVDYKNPQRIKQDIDSNINSGIKRLRRFQLPTGAFTYWPGNREPSNWGTNYAGYFLIEAKKLGYHVPNELISNWIRYEKSQARRTRDRLIERVFRVYLLSLAGEPELGAMNLLKENNLKDMTDTEKWTLAAAYKLAGVNRAAAEIIKTAGLEVQDYNEFSGTYGSGLRDQAMILEKLVIFEHWAEADDMVKIISSALSGADWYSTQTTGYTLLALGKYLKAVEGDSKEKHVLSGYIKLPDGEKIDFNTESINYMMEIKKDFGKEVEVFLNTKSTVNRAFITLNWDGIPLKAGIGNSSKNLMLKVEWLDEDGMTINPSILKQGQSFWGHFTVSSKASYASIDEVALVQIIPAGWEIENTRLSQETMPDWMNAWKLNTEEYVDIRDDRVMWFFDLRRYSNKLDFVVRLNAVTIGDFTLPPTIVEAMYNQNYKVTKAGQGVSVTKR